MMGGMRQSRGHRLARAVSSASIATFAALVSHVLAGGTMPGWLGIIVPWALAVVVCVPLAGTRLPLVRLSAAVLVSQALFHTLFVLGAAPAVVAAGRTAATSAHDHAAPVIASAPAPLAHHDSAGMWLAHAAAAIATIALLHRGERALARLRRLARAVGDRVRRALESAIAANAPARITNVPASPTLRIDAPEDRFLVCVGRRGPPALRIA